MDFHVLISKVSKETKKIFGFTFYSQTCHPTLDITRDRKRYVVVDSHTCKGSHCLQRTPGLSVSWVPTLLTVVKQVYHRHVHFYSFSIVSELREVLSVDWSESSPGQDEEFFLLQSSSVVLIREKKTSGDTRVSIL